VLSILIPIYNWNVTGLVSTLIMQGNALDINYEIICIDDASLTKFKLANRNELIGLPVRYSELENNIGRAKIRNLLCHRSGYPHLLFLDCDSTIINSNFLERYIKEIKKNPNAVLSGGRHYSNKKPVNKKKHLHWYFGKHREALSSSERNLHPYELLHTNNLIIPREALIKHFFDESITGYGYEDLEWAVRLKRANILVRHIDNPVRHDGLKDQVDFIQGIQEATSNLEKLYSSDRIESTRLIRAYFRLRKWGLLPFLNLIKPLFQVTIKISSLGLLSIDLLKVYYFDKCMKKVV